MYLIEEDSLVQETKANHVTAPVSGQRVIPSL